MSSDDINKVIDESILKSSVVAVQIEEVDENGHYSEDIVGKLQGYDDSGFWFGDQLIEYDSIRNIEDYEQMKWSAL